MTATAPEAKRTCPPSAVVDQIVPWPEVLEGDLVLWDGEFHLVVESRDWPGMDLWILTLLYDGLRTVPLGTYAAVRRYQEG